MFSNSQAENEFQNPFEKIAKVLYWLTCCPPSRPDNKPNPPYRLEHAVIMTALLLYLFGFVMALASGINYKSVKNSYDGARESGATSKEIATAKSDFAMMNVYVALSIVIIGAGMLMHVLAACRIRRNQQTAIGLFSKVEQQRASYHSIDSDAATSSQLKIKKDSEKEKRKGCTIL